MDTSSTIVAPATPPGGAIAVIRVSGTEAIAMCEAIFRGRGGALSAAKGYTLHYGTIVDPAARGGVVDEVLVSLFRAPRSYTGEDMVEISCHGSPYIRSEIIRLLVGRGASPAAAGEFTVRAFLAGKMDLSQAEAVADTVAAEDRAAHALALGQMRGGYSSHFVDLRGQLITLTSLLELELDFSQEDVQFADRGELLHTIAQVAAHVEELLSSFALGNAIKEGIGVAIVGRANVGKSTLLNRLVREERAMVSEIAGTTRDAIEERLVVGGATFRLTDTAGLRDTDDRLERMGIERTFASLAKSAIVLLVCTPEDVLDCAAPASAASTALTSATPTALRRDIEALGLRPEQKLCVVVNKTDLAAVAVDAGALARTLNCPVVALSAHTGEGVDGLVEFLERQVDTGAVSRSDAIVSSARHFEALQRAAQALERVRNGLETSMPADLLSQDLREALHHIGIITGQITTDDILGEIFSKFCIGK